MGGCASSHTHSGSATPGPRPTTCALDNSSPSPTVSSSSTDPNRDAVPSPPPFTPVPPDCVMTYSKAEDKVLVLDNILAGVDPFTNMPSPVPSKPSKHVHFALPSSQSPKPEDVMDQNPESAQDTPDQQQSEADEVVKATARRLAQAIPADVGEDKGKTLFVQQPFTQRMTTGKLQGVAGLLHKRQRQSSDMSGEVLAIQKLELDPAESQAAAVDA